MPDATHTPAPDAGPRDDHANSLDEAPTYAAVGGTVQGSIDYDYDEDLFAFDAVEGETYQIAVRLGTLSDSVAAILDADGEELAYNDDYEDSMASRIIWKAPNSGEYYVGVAAYDDTGSYTLTVSIVSASAPTTTIARRDKAAPTATPAPTATSTPMPAPTATPEPAAPTATPAITPTPAPYGCSNGTAVPNPGANPGLVADCAALLASRDTLRGTASLDWSANVAISQWRGIEVSDGRVTAVDLIDAGLNGRIPSELGELAGLDWLFLSINSLTGGIPSELGNLSKLTLLGLNENNLSGSIPPELGNLSRLQSLYLGLNQLSGSVPPELGNLSSLEELQLYANRLEGELPESLTRLTRLGYISFDDNAGLCAPDDSAFQTWLQSVPDVSGDSCRAQTPTATPTTTLTPTLTAAPTEPSCRIRARTRGWWRTALRCWRRAIR